MILLLLWRGATGVKDLNNSEKNIIINFIFCDWKNYDILSVCKRWKILLIFIVEICKALTGKLVHWDNPAASAGMLSGVLALLLSICYYSLVSVLAYISLGLLAAIMAIKVYSTVMVFMKKVREPTTH